MNLRGWLGILVACGLLWSGVALSREAPASRGKTSAPRVEGGDAGAGTAEPFRSSGTKVVMLVVNGGINPATADYIHDGIELGREQGAQAVLIQLDTPGGLLDSTKSIVKEILGAPLPVIVYVAPSGAGAASAGVFVTMAAHVAAMAPGTNIGAAHPVGGQGEDVGGDMREKVENFAVSLSRTIAQQRGRNVDWAEKAVRESVSITEREAVQLKVVDLVAADTQDLLRQVDGREVNVAGRNVVLATAGVTVERHEMRLRQKVLDILANPNVAYLLMMAGILGLYVEFTHPGVFFPGVAGAICLLLGMAALQVLPINYSGLVLIILGLALLIAELFLPSFGVLGVGGIVAFVFGSLLLFDTPQSTMMLDPGIVFGAAATFGGFTLIVGWLVIRAQRRQPALGLEGMIGEIGEVKRTGGAGGRVKVFVHGEYWDADCEDLLAVGDAVEVTGATGLRMRVRKHGG
jgi:membrane-bound serine protease (ClpP class)